MEDRSIIRWRVHLASPPGQVYPMLATAEGRRRFWAASAEESDGVVEFRFTNGQVLRGRVLERDPPRRFAVEYFGGSAAAFDLVEDGQGGTDLTLTEAGVPPEEWEDNRAGWVTVLLTLKAAIDFAVDLRSCRPPRCHPFLLPECLPECCLPGCCLPGCCRGATLFGGPEDADRGDLKKVCDIGDPFSVL